MSSIKYGALLNYPCKVTEWRYLLSDHPHIRLKNMLLPKLRHIFQHTKASDNALKLQKIIDTIVTNIGYL